MSSKPIRSGLRQGVLLVVGILIANSVLGAERVGFGPGKWRMGSSQSPVSWESVEAKTAIDRSAALASARRAIGGLDKDAAPAWIELAILTDKHPFGEVFADRPVWLVKFPAVRVDRGDNKADPVEVAITGVIDANDGRLLEAYTPAKDIWFLPMLNPRDPEAAASRDGWSVSPCTVLRMRSTVAEVLGALWKQNAIDPKKAGQIIVRPRNAAPALPAIEVDGKLLPTRQPGPYWITHVIGTIIRGGGGGPRGVPKAAERPYMTGLIALVDEDSVLWLQGAYLP